MPNTLTQEPQTGDTHGTPEHENESIQTVAEEPDDEVEKQQTLEMDEMFHLLQSNRRRLVLKHLHGCEGEVVMRDLVEEVAADEYDTTVKALGSKQRQRVYISLYQRHLPKLDEAGIIEYNQDRGLIERNALAEELEAHLDVSSGDQDGDQDDAAGSELSVTALSDQRYHLVATAVSATLLAALYLGLAPAAVSGGAIPATIILITFLLAFLARDLDLPSFLADR